MAKMNTSHRYIYDAAPATLFRARTAAAVTADGNSTEVVLDEVKGYWNTAGELADETVAVIVNVTALDEATGDETYDFTLKATDGAGTVQIANLGTIRTGAVGQYVFLLDVATLKLVDGDVGGLLLALDVSGTTPSITYHAWMSQIKKA
jgi:hypothetical protein